MILNSVQVSSPLQRILVADDYPQVAAGLAKCLRLLGCTVETAEDGAQALEAAERFLPQLMLLDIEMPKLSGCEVAECIRQQAWGKNIVLVAFTALGRDEDRRRMLKAGFDDHLVKPVAPSDIVSLLSDRWQQMSVRRMLDTAVKRPNPAELRRAFEAARSAFDRIRQLEQQLQTQPNEMLLLPDNSGKQEDWMRIDHHSYARGCAYGEFREAQRNYGSLLDLHIKALEGQRQQWLNSLIRSR